MKRKGFIKQSGALMAISPLNIFGSSLKAPGNKNSNNVAQEKFCTACGTAFPKNNHIPTLPDM
ncbi:MAG: hypothetical protein ABI168_06245 [Ginsengibacter sp.]